VRHSGLGRGPPAEDAADRRQPALGLVGAPHRDGRSRARDGERDELGALSRGDRQGQGLVAVRHGHGRLTRQQRRLGKAPQGREHQVHLLAGTAQLQ
jgi:hypothetical protein